MNLMQMLTNPRCPPLDVRPLAKRIARVPIFMGEPVETDETGRHYHLDGEGRRWFLDGSGEVA